MHLNIPQHEFNFKRVILIIMLAFSTTVNFIAFGHLCLYCDVWTVLIRFHLNDSEHGHMADLLITYLHTYFD